MCTLSLSWYESTVCATCNAVQAADETRGRRAWTRVKACLLEALCAPLDALQRSVRFEKARIGALRVPPTSHDDALAHAAPPHLGAAHAELVEDALHVRTITGPTRRCCDVIAFWQLVTSSIMTSRVVAVLHQSREAQRGASQSCARMLRIGRRILAVAVVFMFASFSLLFLIETVRIAFAVPSLRPNPD